MKKIYRICQAAFVATVLTACADYDNGFEQKKMEYEKNFKELFGDIDPNQDWNMSMRVQANLNLPGVSSKATVKIYEVDPLSSVNARYLSDVSVIDGKAKWEFDAPKADKELFVHVMQDGQRLYAGYCNVTDGIMNISADNLHKKTSGVASRAMGTGVGDLLWTELCFEESKNSDGVLIDRNYYQNCVRQIKIESDGYVYYTPNITSTPFRKLAYNNDIQDGYYLSGNRDIKYADGAQEIAISSFDLMTYVIYSGGKYQFKSDVHYAHQAHVAKAYAINESAVTTLTDDTKWLIGDCKDLFWTGDAPVAEGVDYRDSRKTTVYTKCGTNVEEMEKAVIFTTNKDDAEIDIPMMYGATDKHNILGYYYYESDQDPRDVNRYVLFSDARPTTNIKVNNVFVPSGMTLESQGSYKDEDVVSCVTRHLMYFGRDGELTGTTKFPKNVKIGFFIRRHADTYNTGAATLPGEGGWAFSDPTLNYQHIYDAESKNLTFQGTNWTYRGSRSVSGINSDTNKGNVKAMCWNYAGRNLVGFGDDTGDCDLNDFVFWVNGDVDTPSKLRIGANTNEDVYEWIVACEDLGSTDDYDFNDVVFGVKHYTKASNIYTNYYDADGNLVTSTPTVVEKKNYLVVTPYAAGGTLKSNIWYNNTRNLGEIHSLLDRGDYSHIQSGEMPMLNTRSRTCEGTPVVIGLGDTEEFTITNLNKFSINVAGDGKRLESNENAAVITAPVDGEAPQMLVLPCGWDWPTERTGIQDAYPDFTEWVSTATLADWNAKKNSSAVVTNPYKTASSGGSSGGGEQGSDEPDYSSYGTELSFAPVTIENNSNTFIGVSINTLKEISETGPVTITLICSAMDQWNKSANAIYYQQNNKGWVDGGNSSSYDYENKMVTITLSTDLYNKFVTPEVEYDKALIQLTNITVKKMFIKVNE